MPGVLYILISYLVGSILGGYILARALKLKDFAKVDLPGAAGTTRQTNSIILGILVGLFDALKGSLIVLLGKFLNLNLSVIVAGALFCVAGHNWPVFFKFKGGGGLATSIGTGLVLVPKLTGLSLGVAVIFGLIYSRFLRKMVPSILRTTAPAAGGAVGVLILVVLSLIQNASTELIIFCWGLMLVVYLKAIQRKISHN